MTKDYYIKHRRAIRASQKKYSELHKNEIKKRKALWYKRNRARIRKQQQQYYVQLMKLYDEFILKKKIS